MSSKKRNRLLDAPDEALRDILSGLENQQTEGWRSFWKQLEGKDLQDLTQMSLTIAMRVLALSQQDPDKAIKYFRDQQIMPFPRFLPKSELARFGDFFQQIIDELEWGKDVKAVKESGKLLNVHLYNIRYLFDDLRGLVHEEQRYILYKEDHMIYDDSLLESIKQLPDLDKDSVGKWSIVMRDWILAIDQLPWEERYWVSPDPDEAGYTEPYFPYHEGTYWLFINAIKKGLEKETEDQLATRTNTHYEIERKAVKNLSEHYNIEMEDGFPKEWENLTEFDDFGSGRKWENHVWAYQEYQKLKQKRHDSLDEAEQAAKSKLLHKLISRRLAGMVS